MLLCPSVSCTYKVASGLPDRRSKGRGSVEYPPEGTGCERGPCAPQIPSKEHLRLKGHGEALEVKRPRVQGSRPGAAWELGGELISRLLPGAALPRPAPGQPGRRPAAGGRAAWCSRCSSHEPGGPRWPRRSGPSPVCPCRVSAPCPRDASEPQNPGNRGRDSASVPHGSPPRVRPDPVHALFSAAEQRSAGGCLEMTDLGKFEPGRRCIRRER